MQKVVKRLKQLKEKINNPVYVDEIKSLARNKKELKTEMMRSFSKNIEMKFGIRNWVIL